MSGVNKWFVFADEDWLVAKMVMENGIYNQVCFHCHQGVEKLLEGVLSASKKRIIKTHNLSELLGMVVEILPDIKTIEDDCVKLDRYYIPTRYPDALPGTLESGLPNMQDAQEAMRVLDKMNSLVKKAFADID